MEERGFFLAKGPGSFQGFRLLVIDDIRYFKYGINRFLK